MNFIKVYGLPRCGTNYLEKLIEINFKDVFILSNILGWKHAIPQDHIDIDWKGHNWEASSNIIRDLLKVYKKFENNETQIRNAVNNNEIKYIFILKNPIEYLNSYKYQKRIDITYNLDVNIESKKYLYYYIMYNKFIKENKESSIFINYHHFEKYNIDYNLNIIKEKFNLIKKNDDYIQLKNVIDPFGNIEEDKYIKKRIYLSESDIEIIKNNVDINILNISKSNYF